MYLPKPGKNKYSIGKYLRSQKYLRKTDEKAKVIQMPQELKQYTEELENKGMVVKNLDYAMFYTKNGLPYPGLIAKEKILANTIMLRVPLESLLTTRIAFFSDIQIVFQQNPKYFSRKFTTDWEDHILLAFILYEYQKGKNSKWFNLIRNLPKDIDYAVFWNKKELDIMEDKWMQLGIQQQRAIFQQQSKDFMQICEKYPQYFIKSTYTLENIKWIQSHLVTRCFGKYFEYTTMVPFAQLFNHQCVDVYYSMDYKPGNPHTQNEEFYAEKDLTQGDEIQIQSSDGSYDAQDFFGDDQFFEAAKQLQNKHQSAFSQHPNMSIDKDIKSIKSYMLTFISFNDAVSLNFLLQIFKQIQIVSKTEIKVEQGYEQLKEKLKQIHSLNVKYVKTVKQYYADDIKSKMYLYGIKQKKKKQIKAQDEQVIEGQKYFDDKWPEDKFDDFVMLCSTKDQFQKGSQVYFCYGRLPNKLLLLRYGISLQYNKYNHLFLRVDISERIKQVQSFKFVVQNEVNMRKYKRFKLKRTKFCVQLMTYLRGQKWVYPQNVDNIFSIKDVRKQIKLLQQAKQLFVNELRGYNNSLQRNREKIYDKTLNYHEYFCLIHKIENQEILDWHIKMANYAKQVFQKYIDFEQKKSLKQILLEQVDPEKLMMQIMNESYFRVLERRKQ